MIFFQEPNTRCIRTGPGRVAASNKEEMELHRYKHGVTSIHQAIPRPYGLPRSVFHDE